MSYSHDEKNALIRAILGATSRPRNALADLVSPTPASALPGSVPNISQLKRRRVFFSFHYADIMRVNNVCLSGEFVNSASQAGRDVEGFYDNGLWESRRREGDDAIKALIREG